MNDRDEAAQALLKTVGRNVRAARQALALTLKELAEASDLSTRFLSQIENGEGNVSIVRLQAVAKALGRPLEDLIASPSEPGPKTAIALLGLRGAGKSTIGRRAAAMLRIPFIELDHEVELAAGMKLSEIFAIHGEDYYRRLERSTLAAIAAEGGPKVVATGGGVVTSPESYALLRSHFRTIWLKARAEDHWNRVIAQGDRRPMANNPRAMAELRSLLAHREPLYALADITLDTSEHSLPETVKRVVAAATM
jgi:XRE family aerobic/anaerobic benzoate catabolism transcriptional regulator